MNIHEKKKEQIKNFFFQKQVGAGDSHEHGLASDARVLENLSHGLACLLDALHVARVHHKHHAVGLGVVVLPNAADALAAAQVEDGHLELALLQVHLGEAHCGCHVLGVVWGAERTRFSTHV